MNTVMHGKAMARKVAAARLVEKLRLEPRPPMIECLCRDRHASLEAELANVEEDVRVMQRALAVAMKRRRWIEGELASEPEVPRG